jgi:hypothetical protein
MSRKTNTGQNPGENDLWIAPNHTLKGPRGERAWESRPGGIPSNSRYLELADIALGLKKPVPKKKRHHVHETIKNEPYNQK